MFDTQTNRVTRHRPLRTWKLFSKLWPGSSDPFAVESEVSLATDPRSQMNIFGHDRHPLGMDGT